MSLFLIKTIFKMPIKAFNPSLFTLFLSQIFKKHQNKSAKYNTTVFLFCKYAAITRHTKYTCFFGFFYNFTIKSSIFHHCRACCPRHISLNFAFRCGLQNRICRRFCSNGRLLLRGYRTETSSRVILDPRLVPDQKC